MSQFAAGLTDRAWTGAIALQMVDASELAALSKKRQAMLVNTLSH